MNSRLFEISDKIKLIEFGNIIHPITFIVSLLLSLGLIIPLIDLYGGGLGLIVFISILFIGYSLQKHIYKKIRNNLINSIEVIDHHEKIIMEKITSLSQVILNDIGGKRMRIDNVNFVHSSFLSILSSIHLFRKSLKETQLLSQLILTTDESENTKKLKFLIGEIEIYLRDSLIHGSDMIDQLLKFWIKKHKIDLSEMHSDIKNLELSNVSGKGALALTAKHLEVHIANIEKIDSSLN